MKNDDKLAIEGKWVSAFPSDSDDYLVEYLIEKSKDGKIKICARDLQDEEEMEISNIKWDGNILFFQSFMPSTERVGFAQFRLKENGNIESKFTFTVLEELKRID